MKNSAENSKNKKTVIIAAAAAVVLIIAAVVFFASRGFFKGGDAASSQAQSAGEASAAVSAYGRVEDFDYENFTYSDGLDEKGYWSGLRALDYVTLPEDFASVTVARSEVEPSDEDIQSQLDYLLNQSAASVEVTDRAAENGDTVNIDYKGSVDGVVFTGGTAEDYDLTLGSGTFIDGFEEQIVGHVPGDTFDVNVTFPDGYGDTTDEAGNTVTLSGKAAVFSVTLNHISETVLPELTDEWVENSFGESYDLHTAEQLRAYFTEQMYQSNLKQYLIDYIVTNSSFKELPKAVTDYQVKQCLNYYSTLAGYYGYDLDTFVKSVMGSENADTMLASMDSSIEQYSKEALVYQAIAEQLGLEPTQEQIDVYADYVDTYGANYCRMIAVMDASTQAIVDGAKVS